MAMNSRDIRPANMLALDDDDSAVARVESKIRKFTHGPPPFADGPLCMASLRGVPLQLQQLSLDKGPVVISLDQANPMFEESISPLYKLKESNFLEIVPQDEHKQRLLQALTRVARGETAKEKVRNIEMTTLAESNSGMPIKRHFDWTVGTGRDGTVLLFGDQVTEHDTEQRAKDAELVDFFQNAPIALHWLSGEGKVLWANQRELDVLGYTAEEYIGQSIMKFCPDEEKLVLEIFKQLGSGNSIRDVPVRFRTKTGKIVNLLIDSNVKYDDAGNFAHTRCFIRDDTGRKIREAKAKLLLEETKRSLTMLDNFMSRSLHHMRTPLQVLQLSMDIVSANLKKISKFASAAVAAAPVTSASIGHDGGTDPHGFHALVHESQCVLEQAGNHVKTAVAMLDDISDLARFDQGQEMALKKEPVQLKEFGQGAFASLEIPSNVEASIELTGGGPPYIYTDPVYLNKVLCHLLGFVTSSEGAHEEKRVVSLVIGHTALGQCTFAVVSSAHALSSAELDHIGNSPQDPPLSESGSSNELPGIFSRYHQELVPSETCDFEAAGSLRQKIEAGVNSHTMNGIGIGLSLSHHLVRALGGDLRYSAQHGMTRFWFALSDEKASLGQERIVIATANTRASARSTFAEAKVKEEFIAKPEQIAAFGLSATEKPSVLVVEDTKMCAKLLCRVLEKLDCSTKWVENGMEAVNELRANPGFYDLILMDLRMPVMDGLTATTIIKKELQVATPVVAVTGDTAIDLKEQCRQIGFEEVCSKPMKQEELVRVIDTHVGERTRA